MFTFYNTFLNLSNISSLSSTGMIISSTGFCFTILSLFVLVTLPAILFPKNLPALWTTFWKQFLQHLVLYPVVAFYIFLQMIKYVSSLPL